VGAGPTMNARQEPTVHDHASRPCLDEEENRMTRTATPVAQALDDLGLIEVAIVELPESWDGSGLEPLLELADRDAIRILDVEEVLVHEDGSASLVEPGGGPASALSDQAVFAGCSSGLLDDEDAAEAAAMLAAGRNGLVVVYESTWTARLAATLRGRGGRLLGFGHVSGDALEAALGEEN
jgi:hypothetical protein